MISQSIDNLIKNVIMFANALNIIPEEDFNRHDRMRLQTQKYRFKRRYTMHYIFQNILQSTI